MEETFIGWIVRVGTAATLTAPESDALMRLAASLILFLFGLTAIGWADPAPADARSSIAHDADRQLWTIGNGTVQWLVAGDPGTRSAGLVQVRFGPVDTWAIANGVDGLLTIDGRPREIGRFRDRFAVDGVSPVSVSHGVQLDVVMPLTDMAVTVTRHYALYDESPALELWTTVSSFDSRPHVLSDLNGCSVTVPAGSARWVNGLQGDNADVYRAAAFTMQARALQEGESLAIGSRRRGSEQQLPWITVESRATFFAGVMWSGAWALTATRSGSALRLQAGLGSMQTVLAGGESVDGPHVFLGATAGGMTAVSRAVERFVVNGLRAGRPLVPLVTYNTWFAYGTDIDEASMLAEMDRAAALGAELFVLDAGWYQGAGAGGRWDFDSGLGSWEADPDRFPNGLRALSDHAHDLGIRFGLWVEPERVHVSTVGGAGADERWLAQAQGAYQAAQTAQICLAGPAAREWIFQRLISLIEAVQPDYLKWDNNFWINCDRESHGHGASDGNFAHTRGLYELLARLRQRYPSLLIENVSGGGNRLDVGMLRFTDVAWMDDRTAPSVLVRRNLEGLSPVLPPAYLLSFAVDQAGESLHHASDLALNLRSRMAGILGLSFRMGDFTDGELAEMERQVAVYTSVRGALAAGSAALLTPQAGLTPSPAWDALQIAAADGSSLIIDAFQADPGSPRLTITPHGLDPTATYDVRSPDAGPLGFATGAELMNDGVEVNALTPSAAHILLLTRRAATDQTTAK
jgi:alpha-galactosidase